MSVAFFFQYVMELEPCALCMLQRVMVVGAGIFSLVAAIHNPATLGIRIYGGVVILFSALGGGIAIRQLWLQSLPPDQVPACAPSLDYMMDVFPLLDVLEMILTADGSCAEVLWTFMGLSIPGWTLVGFIGLLLIGVFQVARPKKVTT
jgi:disulfide bond formation protein DsbB